VVEQLKVGVIDHRDDHAGVVIGNSATSCQFDILPYLLA